MRSLPNIFPLLNFQILETFPVFPAFPVFLGKKKEEKMEKKFLDENGPKTYLVDCSDTPPNVWYNKWYVADVDISHVSGTKYQVPGT